MGHQKIFFKNFSIPFSPRLIDSHTAAFLTPSAPFLPLSFKQGVRNFIRYINEYILAVKWIVLSQIDFFHKSYPPFLNFGGKWVCQKRRGARAPEYVIVFYEQKSLCGTLAIDWKKLSFEILLKTKKARNLPIANHGLFVRIICRIDEEICVVYAAEAVFISSLLENYPLLLSFYGQEQKTCR